MTTKRERHSIIAEIKAERERQIAKEGWSQEHDDQHGDGSIGMAAACYAAGDEIYVCRDHRKRSFTFEDAWPWERRCDKREKHCKRKNLVVAAALLVAEIERLDRKGKTQ